MALEVLKGNHEAKSEARTFARSMLLNGAPTSPEAKALVDAIINTVIVPYRQANEQKQFRPSMVAKFREALEPFLTDLLAAAKDDRWSTLASNTNALWTYPGGANAINTMRAAMAAAGLLDELKGYYQEMFNGQARKARRQCFRPTRRLLAMASDHGISLQDFSLHFRPGKVKTPARPDVVVARAAKTTKKGPAKALTLNLDEDLKAAAIAAFMERLNSYLMAEGRISGIVFTGLRRVFVDADQRGFDWQWHGRFYSIPGGDSYESMGDGSKAKGSGKRARAQAIRIDGQEIAEVDISASHLTILHGLLDLPFDTSRDPYDLPGFDRNEVKNWLTTALGASDASMGGPRYTKIRAAGIERYPFLANLPNLGVTSHDLAYHEAEIMQLAMADLMDNHGIGFLPVHDALMVAQGNKAVAIEALRGAFKKHFRGTLGKDVVPIPRVN